MVRKDYDGRVVQQMLLLAVFCCSTAAAADPSLAPLLTSKGQEYTIRAGDTLTAIASRFGMQPITLAAQNGRNYSAIIRPD